MTPDEQKELDELNELRALAAVKAGKPDEGFNLLDNLKNIGTAAYKGVAGIAAGAADALAGSHDVSDIVGAAASGKPPRPLDTSMPVSRALEETGYQPKTQAQRYVNAGVRGVTSGLVSPAGLAGPMRSAVTGGMAGLGSEGAGQLPGVHGTAAEPYARVAGALLGGVTGGIASSTVGNSKNLASEMFKGVNPTDIDRAKELMAKSRIAGLPVNLDQAMGKDTNITNLVKALVSRKEGQPVVDQLRGQTEQARQLATRVTDGLPGNVQEPAVIANNSQAAATDAIKAARAARTAQTKPLFDRAGNVDDSMLETMHAQVKAAAEAAPDTNKGMLLSKLADILDNAKKRAAPQDSGFLDQHGNPIMNPGTPVPMEELNASLRSTMNQAKNVNLSTSANDKEAVGALGKMVGDLRDQMGAVSPEFKAANALYAKISADTVDPLKKSVVGRVAGISGELADKEAVNKLLPVLAKGRNPEAATSEILEFAAHSPPPVLQDAVKTHFSNAVAKAETQVNGKLSPDLPSAIEQSLLGDKMQRQGMHDMLNAIGRQVNPAEPDLLRRGFMHAMEIMSAAAKRPGSIGVGAGELDAITKQSHVAQGLSMIGLAPGKPLGRGLERLYSANAYRTIAENLTTPEGVAKLQALAKVPLMGPKAQVMLATMLAGQSADKGTGIQQSNPGGNDQEKDAP